MSDKKKIALFTTSSYLLFWLLFIVLGAGLPAAGLALEGYVLKALVAICSWTPTFAVLIFRKKLCPNGSVKEFYKNAFKDRINVKLLLFVTVLELAIFFIALNIFSHMKAVPVSELFSFSFGALAISAFWTFIQGAGGEESGWRGFLQPMFEKKHGVVISAIFTGLIWSFWHTPTWVFEPRPAMEMLQFVGMQIVMITSASVIFGICYSHCRNLFVPFWMHFTFNLLNPLLININEVIVDYSTVVGLFYAAVAVGFSIWHKYDIGKHDQFP